MVSKKSKIPYFFFAFFGVIFLVDMFYIYISQKSFHGIATQNSYQKGLKYNEALKLAKEQENLGWKVEMKFKNLGNLLGNLRVKLTDKNGQIIKGANIKVKLRNPTRDGFDFEQNLLFNGQNYLAKISFPIKGQWDFEIIAMKDADLVQDVKRYLVR